MKKILYVMGRAIIGLIGIALSLATSTDLMGSGGSSLNTQKIDKNIDELRELEWFNAFYESERHRKSFSINFKVRKYLQSTILVTRLKTSEREQQKFIQLLERVAELREKSE
ncbi:nitrite reductase [Chryseomicrobium palamuruense]|uniref:Nitrite reductase n=1 Tax=Chryseomicrobium palamuruense TaxID=682973 RepID=A0ABV8USR8_9BACL